MAGPLVITEFATKSCFGAAGALVEELALDGFELEFGELE
jgi:hypothetical protein